MELSVEPSRLVVVAFLASVALGGGAVAQFSFRTDAAAHVADFQAGPHDDPTVRLFTDPATVERIADAPDRAAAFEAAVRAGDVRIEGVGLVNTALVALVGLVLWALASPLQAAAVGAVVVLGAGVLVLAGTKAVAGGAVIAGSAGTAGTAGASGAGMGSVGTTGTGTAGTGGATAASPTATGAGTGTSTATTGSSAVGPAAEPTAGAPAQAGGNTMTAGGSLDPVSLADQGLSVFERALFIVAIVKKLARRTRRSIGAAAAVILGWFGFARLTEDEGESVGEAVDAPERPVIRRRGVPRRRRR